MVDLMGVLSLSLGQYPPTLLSQSHHRGSSSLSRSRLARLADAVRIRLSTLPRRDLDMKSRYASDQKIGFWKGLLVSSEPPLKVLVLKQ